MRKQNPEWGNVENKAKSRPPLTKEKQVVGIWGYTSLSSFSPGMLQRETCRTHQGCFCASLYLAINSDHHNTKPTPVTEHWLLAHQQEPGDPGMTCTTLQSSKSNRQVEACPVWRSYTQKPNTRCSAAGLLVLPGSSSDLRLSRPQSGPGGAWVQVTSEGTVDFGSGLGLYFCHNRLGLHSLLLNKILWLCLQFGFIKEKAHRNRERSTISNHP